jgi:hypothetical protein
MRISIRFFGRKSKKNLKDNFPDDLTWGGWHLLSSFFVNLSLFFHHLFPSCSQCFSLVILSFLFLCLCLSLFFFLILSLSLLQSLSISYSLSFSLSFSGSFPLYLSFSLSFSLSLSVCFSFRLFPSLSFSFSLCHFLFVHASFCSASFHFLSLFLSLFLSPFFYYFFLYFLIFDLANHLVWRKSFIKLFVQFKSLSVWRVFQLSFLPYQSLSIAMVLQSFATNGIFVLRNGMFLAFWYKIIVLPLY